MDGEATPPVLTAEDRRAIEKILDDGKVLPCGGRTWAGPFNDTQPIYRLVFGTRNAISARRLVKELKNEEATGVLQWANSRLYAEHWECIDHVTGNKAKAAKAPELPFAPPELVDPPRYPRAWAPEHPVAHVDGGAYVHRRVLYDRLGPGAHRCYWCRRDVDWDAPVGDPAELTADHLNADPSDNHPSNLVASCRPCNVQRRGPADLNVQALAAVAASEPVVEPTGATTRGNVDETSTGPGPTSLNRTSGRSGTLEALDRGLGWLQGNRRATVALVLLGLFLVGLFGTAWLVTSPAAFLPGVRTDPHDGPEPTWPATTVLLLPGESPSTSELQPPTTRAASTTTAWTLPEPCTPTHCPSLDD